MVQYIEQFLLHICVQKNKVNMPLHSTATTLLAVENRPPVVIGDQPREKFSSHPAFIT